MQLAVRAHEGLARTASEFFMTQTPFHSLATWPDVGPLLRKPAACTFLGGICGATLDRYVASGKLRRVKIGGHVSAYLLSDLVNLITISSAVEKSPQVQP